MTKFHPAPEQLSEFAQGALASVESLMISAHCDMCARCQQVVAQQTVLQAEHALMDTQDDQATKGHSFQDDSKLDSMLESITQLPRAAPSKTSRSGSRKIIELDGRVFTIPRTLRKYVPFMGNWSSLVGKLWQAPVDVGVSGVANFIYIGQGGSIPEHTHRGTEYTLVINGEFSDGLNHYRKGDFIKMNESDIHAPYSDDISGCLIFSILNQPLHFTAGIARLLNPFSHLFFRY